MVSRLAGPFEGLGLVRCGVLGAWDFGSRVLGGSWVVLSGDVIRLAIDIIYNPTYIYP